MEEKRARHLCRILAAASLGRRDTLSDWYGEAVGGGVPVADLQEATLQLFLFAGFPRAIGAFQALHAALDIAPPPPRVEAGPVDFAARGRETFGKIYGHHAEEVTAMLEALHPDFARFVLEGAYGKVLGRTFLPIAEREVLAVAMLAALGQRRQLRAHVRGALRVGVSPDLVREALAAAEEAADQELTAAREIVERALSAPPPE